MPPIRISTDGPLALTHALRRPATAAAAIEVMLEESFELGVVEIEGLVEILQEPPSAKVANLAVAALSRAGSTPVVDAALRQSLRSDWNSVRLSTIGVIDEGQVESFAKILVERLESDASWMVRRAAMRRLATSTQRWQIVIASDDPHWRVRHALVDILLDWGTQKEMQAEILQRLDERPHHVRTQGLFWYLKYRWEGDQVLPDELPTAPDSSDGIEFWDWYPAVLACKLEQLGEEGRAERIDIMPQLLGHDELRVRRMAADAIYKVGKPSHFAEAVEFLFEKRHEAAISAQTLLDRLNLDRLESVAQFVLDDSDATPQSKEWAQKQIEELPKLIEGDEEPTKSSTDFPDSHPFSRAASLTDETAAELLENPERETSWHVLSTAARMRKVPLWEIEPEVLWEPPRVERPVLEQIAPTWCEPPDGRLLGSAKLNVSRVGISGHYGLPVEGYSIAVEAGVNLMFWEPNYGTMTEFFGRIAAQDRDRIHSVAGTFEADGRGVRRDVERVLRLLKIDCLSLFLMFWVHSWARITDEVQQTLDDLVDEGKIKMFGLSTHSRPLAVEAIQAGWDPVMVRHSAAHRGAEELVFPAAIDRGTSIITFNNTCYGRLLQPIDDSQPSTPSDCYRYTLAHDGVTLCLSAPATLEQLDENLAALISPAIDRNRFDAIQHHGSLLYREEKTFFKLVRSL